MVRRPIIDLLIFKCNFYLILIQNIFLSLTGVPNVTIVASSFEVQICNSITIECTVTAIPVVTSVYWTSNVTGQITNIRPSSNPSKYGGSTTLTPSLTIFNANFSDAGNYQCFANNYIGTGSSQEISLDVQGGKTFFFVTSVCIDNDNLLYMYIYIYNSSKHQPNISCKNLFPNPL